jgi:stage IV sporulation protein FB
MAKATALGICAAAFAFQFDDVHNLLPTRFALLLLAIFLFFSAKHEEKRTHADPFEEGEPFSPALSGSYTRSGADEVREPLPASGPFSRWREQRRESKARHQRDQELEDERRLDQILARVHEQGLSALSNDERALLNRVSARYRDRRSS